VRLEIRWRPDTLIRFFAMLLFCFGISGVAGFWMYKAIDAGLPLDEKTGAILINVFFLDFGILAITWMLLKDNQIGWQQAFGFSKDKIGAMGVLALLTAIGGFFMAAMLGGVMTVILESLGFEVSPQEVVDTFQNTESLFQRMLLGCMAVLLAPIVEEILFRGVLYSVMRQYLPGVWAVWGSSLFFGLVHANKVSLIPLTCLAVILIRLYEKTGNLWAPIMAHAFFNSINLSLMLMVPEMIEMNTP
jgi:membrane protease YdiL (CAAX protease family)